MIAGFVSFAFLIVFFVFSFHPSPVILFLCPSLLRYIQKNRKTGYDIIPIILSVAGGLLHICFLIPFFILLFSDCRLHSLFRFFLF